MKVQKTTTGLIIREPSTDIKRACLRYFSLQKPIREFFIYSGNDPDHKPILGHERDVIYITSGFLKINDSVIKKLKIDSTKEIPTPMKIELTMNREPRSDLQRDCIQLLTTSDSNKITVELKPGTGKAEPYSRKIPTPTKDGFTLMGDLKIGDHVFAQDGTLTKVTGIFEQGEQDIYKVTFQDGRVAYCHEEHLWTVKRNDCSQWETVMTNEMDLSVDNFAIPLCEPVQYNDKPFVGYECGSTYETIYHSMKDSYVCSSPSRIQYLFQDKGIGTEGEFQCDEQYAHNIWLPMFYQMGYSAYYSGNTIHYSKPESLKIKSVEFSHREKCRCIMVDNPAHMYLTEDFIVTHNTFIALYSTAKLGLKPLIVAPTTLLKNQWIDNIVELGIDKSDIATKIWDAPDKKICVVTISSLEGALRDDWNGLLKTMDKASFGIKVVDEAHLHLKGMLKFDALCNIKHNWYMSATLGRSDASEDRILNYALLDAERFIGNAAYEEYQNEYVQVYLQDIYYFPSNRLCEQYFKYGSKGLIRSSYYNMLMNYRNGVPFINNIITMLKRAKSVINYDGKILLLVPLLSIIKRVIEVMKQDPYFSKYTFAAVDGSMPLKERREAMESNFILSTSLSMGTGVDVSNLGVVVNFDQYSSSIIGEQIFGRLRDRGKETYYIDVCDNVRQARMLVKWGQKRRILIPYYPGAKREMKRFPRIIS